MPKRRPVKPGLYWHKRDRELVTVTSRSREAGWWRIRCRQGRGWCMEGYIRTNLRPVCLVKIYMSVEEPRL